MVAAPGRTSPSRLARTVPLPAAARAAARRGGRFRSAARRRARVRAAGRRRRLRPRRARRRRPGTQAAAAGPALVGKNQTGDVAAIYAAARDSVVSIKTNGGSGTGFVVDADGTIVTNAHVVGSASTVAGPVRRRRDRAGRVTGVDRSSDLAVVKVDDRRAR